MNNPKLFSTLAVVSILFAAQSASATVRKCDSDRCNDDATITKNVRELLDRHAEFGPPNSIDVQSFDHVVYLRGTVDTGLEKRIAETIASEAPDVARVVNSITENN